MPGGRGGTPPALPRLTLPFRPLEYDRVTTVSKRDYYESLGIARDASESEIKTAYRRIAVK